MVISNILKRIKGLRVIVYYGSARPRWATSYAIYELSHKGLGIKRNDIFDAVIDETLAYPSLFKLRFLNLHKQKQYIKFTYMYRVILNESYKYGFG